MVEASKTARKHLKQLELDTPLQVLELAELNEHTAEAELEALLALLLAGHDVGLLSEAGCPAVADPRANLVRLAHRYGITVEPLVGPSSILLALMGSGSQGQRFAFNGYLPVPEAERIAAIRRLVHARATRTVPSFSSRRLTATRSCWIPCALRWRPRPADRGVRPDPADPVDHQPAGGRLARRQCRLQKAAGHFRVARKPSLDSASSHQPNTPLPGGVFV